MESKSNKEMYKVIFELKTKIHIGYLPSKSSVISPTRYYVPGKNIWAALTKKSTEEKREKDYGKEGKEIKKNLKISYFYIYADGKSKNEKTIYLPQYNENGLRYGDMTKNEFEHRFISSFISTGVDYNKGIASDGTLHEIEFIKDKYVGNDGKIKKTELIGMIEKNEKYDLDILKEGLELSVGGELNSGFGDIIIKKIAKIDEKIFGNNNYLYGHANIKNNVIYIGKKEVMAGRGYFDPEKLGEDHSDNPEKKDKKSAKIKLISEGIFLVPGTKVENKVGKNDIEIKMRWDGKNIICKKNRCEDL